MSVGTLHEEHRPAVSQCDDLGTALRSQLFRQRLLENHGAFERPMELRETDTGPLPCLVLDVNKSGVPAKREFALHKQSHTPSGAPGMFGPSECEPEHSGDGRIERAGKLQVNEYLLMYVSLTVDSRSPAHAGLDRNSNNAVICDHRSSRDIRASGVAL
jgi:hypothetical protein